MRTKWRSFWSLSSRDRWLTVQALVMLSVAMVALRLLSFARLQSVLAWCSGGKRTRHLCSDDPRQLVRAHVRAVNLAAKNLPSRPACLPRSMVLWWLLRRHGISSELRIGVRKESDKLAAHAWVECENVIVTDADDVRERFASFEQAVFPACVGLSP